MRNTRTVSPTPLARGAVFTMLLVISATALMLLLEYRSLPDLLPVHFNGRGVAERVAVPNAGRAC